MSEDFTNLPNLWESHYIPNLSEKNNRIYQ